MNNSKDTIIPLTIESKGSYLPSPNTIKPPKAKPDNSALLNAAVTLLAEWCLAVEEDASWDGWDEYYKDANYRPGPLRDLIDNKKLEIQNRENYALGMDRFN